MQWGPDADAKLFMHVLKIHNVKLDFNALALAIGNDVTPKALTHRISKLRSMAEDASTPVAGANPGLGLPQPSKRSPAKRASRVTATTGKKVATAANKTSVTGTKRTATGTAKNGDGKANGGKLLQNVVAAHSGNGDEGGEDEQEELGVETSGKKVKTAKTDVENGVEYESAGGEEGDGGVECA